MSLENLIAGAANLQIGAYNKAITLTNPVPVAYDDDRIAFDVTDVAAGNPFAPYQGFFRTPPVNNLQASLTINSGKADFLALQFNLGEV
jgi:hypothetical protein